MCPFIFLFYSLYVYSGRASIAVVVDASVLLALQLIFHLKIVCDKSHKLREAICCCYYSHYNTEYINLTNCIFPGVNVCECVNGGGGQSAKQCHRNNKWLHLFVNISKQMYSNDGDVETLNNKTLDIKRFWFTHRHR